MGVINFSLTGKTVTDHLRGFMLAGEWRKAIEEAKSTFPEVEERHLVSILVGQMKLTGSTSDDDGLDFVADADESYRKSLHELYSGVTLIDGKLYRPTTIVTDYGVNDFIAAGCSDETEKNVIRREDHDDLTNFERSTLFSRALFYSRGGGRLVKAVMCQVPSTSKDKQFDELVALFEPAFDHPVWFELAPDPQSAVNSRKDLMTYTGHDLLFPKASKIVRAELPSIEARTQKILEQNAELGYGFKTYDFGAPFGQVDVPLAPLIAWAARHLRSYHKADATAAIPDWKPVNPSGLKMNMDDPCHTDWMMGAGLWKPEFWSQELDSRMYELSEMVQSDLIGVPFHVLAGGKQLASGTVRHYQRGDVIDQTMIVIVPNASVTYYEVALKAAATIVLQGGQMSHLAVNGLADNLLIVRIPEARASFQDGEYITLDVMKGITFRHLQNQFDNAEEPGSMELGR